MIDARQSFREILESDAFEILLAQIENPIHGEGKINFQDLAAKPLSLEEAALFLSQSEQLPLEGLAKIARSHSLKHFGQSVLLYTPIYLSNACINGCRYCHYSAHQAIRRKTLTLEEIKLEAEQIAKTGLRHILVLSGESDRAMSFEAFCEGIQVIKPLFDSVAVETYALDQKSYEVLESIGVTGVTLYQETYDQERYAYLHEYGPKADFYNRLEVPMRVGNSGIRQMNLGILMGLGDWKKDLLCLMAHGKWLEKRYGSMEISFSLPRMIAFEGSNFEELGIKAIEDKDFVTALILLRLAFPHACINLSTREDVGMRRALIPIGINKLSAGVSTEVGGRIAKLRGEQAGDEQFHISDDSSVTAVRDMLKTLGYQSVMRDWLNF